MTVHLPEELERYVMSEVQKGRFASADEAVSEAVRLHRQRFLEQTVPPRQLTEEEFEQWLVQRGVLAARQTAIADDSSQRRSEPIRIEGEPFSETIIRERR
jgi:putative addiction module CopG family antidote